MVRRISFQTRKDRRVIINTGRELLVILEERTETLLQHIKMIGIPTRGNIEDLNRHISRYLENASSIKERLEEVSYSL